MEISLMALIQGIPSELNVTFCMAVSTKKLESLDADGMLYFQNLLFLYRIFFSLVSCMVSGI